MSLGLLAFACHSPDPVAITATAEVGPIATTLRFDVTVDPPSPVTVDCTADDDPEPHHADADPYVLRGLLPDTVYRCVVAAGGTTVVLDPTTDPLPADLPSPLSVLVNDDRSAGGFTLFYWFRLDDPSDGYVVIVDREGRIRWYFTVGEPTSSSLDIGPAADGLLVVGGGETVAPRLVDLDGNVVWTSPGPDGEAEGFHHHVEQLPTGEVLSLSTTQDTDGVHVWRGFRVEARDPATDAVAFAWDSQQGVDAGVLAGSPDGNPYHANAVSFVDDDPDGPAAWVSAKAMNQLLRIDRETGELRGAVGPGGVFRLVDPDGDPLPDTAWFYGQHAPEIRWPAVWVIDNGLGRPDGTYRSRVVALTLDDAAKTATLDWEWTEAGWFEPVWGDVDPLDGGTVRITRGHYLPEADVEPLGDGPSAIVEIVPETGEVVWRLALDDAHGVYKSERVDACWLTGGCP